MTQEISSLFLAEMLNGSLNRAEHVIVDSVSSLGRAQSNQVSFVKDKHSLQSLSSSKAGLILISNELENIEYQSGLLLFVENSYVAFAKVAQLLDTTPLISEGIHKTAAIDPTAEIANSVSVGAYTVISKGVRIAEGAQVGSGCHIGIDCQIGKESKIHNNVTLYHDVYLGERCSIHSGTVIGSDGLGFAKDKGEWVKIEHLGKVIIGDNVEIGSNTSIDRGSIGNTHI